MEKSIAVACALAPGQRRDQRNNLLPGLAARATDTLGMPEGYRFTFDAEAVALTAITDTIDAERQCCPFLTFDLHVPAGGGDIVLTLSGPRGTRAFLDALFSA